MPTDGARDQSGRPGTGNRHKPGTTAVHFGDSPPSLLRPLPRRVGSWAFCQVDVRAATATEPATAASAFSSGRHWVASDRPLARLTWSSAQRRGQ